MHSLIHFKQEIISSVTIQKPWLSPATQGAPRPLILADRQGNPSLECGFGIADQRMWYQHGQTLCVRISREN